MRALLFAIAFTLCFAVTAEAKTAPKVEDPAKVQAQLDSFTSTYIKRSCANVRPSKNTPSVSLRDGKQVATYVELDESSVKTELIASNQSTFSYMAKIIYLEHVYECSAATPEEAIAGPYRKVKSRRLTELPRYAKGKWID